MKRSINKCLITGATGYLGTVLVQILHDAGYTVTSLVLPGEKIEYISPYSDIRYADVCDMEALEREASGFDVVIHLAGVIDISTRNRELMRRVNVSGTKNVAELCRRHDMKMIYCSSVHAIPCLPKNETMTEITDFNPDKVKGLYSKTKAEATKTVLDMTRQGLDAMIAFPSGIIGPNERKLSNIGQLISDFLCGSLMAYVDGGYNFVDVRDVAGGIRGMIENWQSGECFILSGYEISVGKMISEIAGASGRKMLRTKLPYWFAMGTSYFAEFYYFLLRKKPLYTHYSMQTIHSNCRFSNQKARDKIGFSPRPLQESLSDMTKWVMEHFITKSGNRYKPRVSVK
ncbi:MAG: NAD-dependent epimerase/dehydratase family protein [Oscillospiraceae bacterium]|jgi:dihydroflavonol-4-reductase|nr:NAD-dependent epimerase/dehydratase family protein [Oscillospiraceae bacterium]